jgi:prepilin-type N-terminal cleavage/methylation domain-containing protein
LSGVFNHVNGRRGFTLVEVIVVMAIIAISLSLAGPRIGAGFGRIELNQAAQTVRSYIKLARLEAQRSDRGQYVVLDKQRHVVALVGPDMQTVREQPLPRSVEILGDTDLQATAVFVAPSGILRGDPVRLRGRTAEIEVTLQ